MKCLHALWFVMVSLLFIGCGGETGKGSASEKDYAIKGKVVAVDPDKTEITLDHEDIPGLMKAMTMSFKVENPKLLSGLKAGDQVQGRVKKGESDYVITQLEKR